MNVAPTFGAGVLKRGIPRDDAFLHRHHRLHNSRYSGCRLCVPNIAFDLDTIRSVSIILNFPRQLLTEPIMSGLSGDLVLENTDATAPTSVGSPA